MKIEHTTVADVAHDSNKKLGYYLFNNQIYYNKMQVLLEASKTSKDNVNKSPEDDIKWFFNNDVFMKFPWHVEPETPLTELYRIRAQQLRDQYDYIRVEASGGSDSSTVVYSFLLNNIHIDEIVFRYPKIGEKGVSNTARFTQCENTLSEYEFATKPMLNWIASNYPKVKITIYDYSEDMIANADRADESWIFKTRHYLQPGHAYKNSLTGFTEHRRLADSGINIGVIYGVDKPKICIKDSKFFLYFFDSLANYNNPDVGDYTNITNEYFYWTPDMPEILAKQAHICKHWFSMPEHYQFQKTLHWPNMDFAARNLYEQLVKGIVYPDYDPNTFQVAKPSNNIYNEMDHWFHVNFKNTKAYNVWEAGINYLLTNFHESYIKMDIHGRASNIQEFMSPFYYVGDSDIPEIGVIKNREFISNSRLPVSHRHVHFIKNKMVIY